MNDLAMTKRGHGADDFLHLASCCVCFSFFSFSAGDALRATTLRYHAMQWLPCCDIRLAVTTFVLPVYHTYDMIARAQVVCAPPGESRRDDVT